MLTFGQISRHVSGREKPSRFYYVRVYDSSTQTSRWVSTKCTSLKAAREWVKTQEMNVALGPERLEKKRLSELTFRAAYREWLEEHEQKASEGRYVNLKSRGDRFWLGFFRDRRLREIRRDDILQYLKKRKAGSILHFNRTGRIGKVCKPAVATLNNDIRDLRTFFNYCLMNEWIDRSPMLGVKNYSGEMRRRVRSLAPEEEERLIAACRESVVHRISAKRNQGGRPGGKVSTEKIDFMQTVPARSYLAPLVVVALNCGFRKRTILSLRWRDIDLEARRWIIPGEFFKTSEDYVAPVPEIVIRELREYRKIVATECEKMRIPPVKRLGKNARIFGLSSKSTFLPAFKRAAKRAGLEGLTFHDCRRIYLNKLRERGVPLETTMALTGHKSVATVMKHYREVPQRDLKEGVAAIDRSTLPGHGQRTQSENG